jgi:23S rRNA (adenine2503-C2)-methyltransferase
MQSIHDQEAVLSFFKEHKIPTFRYGQIENALYKNFVSDFSDIQTIPKEVRELLTRNFFYQSMTIEKEVTSANGQTTKTLWKTHDDKLIESVIMRHLS